MGTLINPIIVVGVFLGILLAFAALPCFGIALGYGILSDTRRSMKWSIKALVFLAAAIVFLSLAV